MFTRQSYFVALLACAAVTAWAGEADTVRVTAQRANLRAEATATSAVLRTLARGATLQALGKTGDWWKVAVSDTGPIGFVHASLVEVKTATQAAASPSTAPEPVQASKSVQDGPPRLFIRSIPAVVDGQEFPNKELEDSVRDLRSYTNPEKFTLVDDPDDAEVMLTVIKRETKLGQPAALTNRTPRNVSEVTATLSVRADGRWKPGTQLTSNGCCKYWSDAASRVMTEASNWLTLHHPDVVARQDSASAHEAAATAAPGSTDKTRWDRRMTQAKRRRSLGIKLGLGGVGLIVLSQVLGSSDSCLENFAECDSGNLVGGGNAMLQTVGLLGGVALTGIGGLGFFGANRELAELDREGRAHGFLSLGHSRGGGVRVALAVRF
jgi:hypothetical protein